MSIKLKISMVLSGVIMVSTIIVTMLTTGVTIDNPTGDMTATMINEIEPYETTYVYNKKKPSTAEPVILKEGVNGLDYTYDGLNYTHLSDKKNEVVEVGSGAPGEYSGRLTGYGPDCPGCSVVGNVSCLTKEGKRHSLITDGVKYNDSTYGKIRILAADNSAFPCGTIIKVDNGILDEFYGIVLDTGITMRRAWKQGTVWIDLAFASEKEALTAGATSSNTKFSVQRWGW